MPKRSEMVLAWHLETASRLLRMTPFWVWLVPAVGAVVFYALDQIPAISPYLEKDVAEIFSPIVLGVGVVLAGWLAGTRRHAYDIWQLVFALSLFMRELHFQGTNTGFYIALVVLLVWASHARDRLEPFISDRRIVVAMMAMLWTYAITKVLDRGYIDDWLPAGRQSRDLFEENLELIGHVIFVTLVIVSYRVLKSAAAEPAPVSAAGERAT